MKDGLCRLKEGMSNDLGGDGGIALGNIAPFKIIGLSKVAKL